MKQDKFTLAVSFMAPLSMGLLMLIEYMAANGAHMLTDKWYAVAAIEVIVFAIPSLLTAYFGRSSGEKVNFRFKPFTRKAFWFVIFMAIMTSLLSFLLNCGASWIFGSSYQPSESTSALSVNTWQMLLIIAVIPAIAEEIFFRGGVFGAFERRGTAVAIVISGLSFAIVHGSADNLIGPFAAGMIYAYMTYVLGSIWPAIIAHLINNVYYMAVSYIAVAFEAFGIWPYFIVINVLLFCIFLYLSMKSLEKLLEKGKIKRFTHVKISEWASETLFAPGLWLLLIMFVIKWIYF